MTDELEVNQETLNPDEEVVREPETETPEELKKAQEIAHNQKIRAEKAEAELKRLKAEAEAKRPKETETLKNENLSLKDIRALQDVHDDDVDDLTDYAKFKNISIAEAKKTPAMQSLLKAKAEERKTAEATNTDKGRRGTTTPTAEQINSDAEAGKEVDPEALAAARLELKRARKL